MSTLLIALGAFVGYLIAYNTYGRWIARRIFVLDPKAVVPSEQLRDNVDYCPTRKEVIFGHHFTSIAGTGPIVGPAIAVFWGWLPALLWVVFGSIFIGAVHDFSALIVSLRNRGQTVGEIAGRIIAPRARVLFLLILFFALTIVIAIFGLVIASIFKIYPESVLSVWLSLPIAIAIGIWVYKRGGGILVPSLIALALLYVAIYVGAYVMPLEMPSLGEMIGQGEPVAASVLGQETQPTFIQRWGGPIVIWTVILLIYCFFASVLPVWLLLQPRDFVNSHQLIVALVLLVVGLGIAGLTGKADLAASTPAIADSSQLPKGAPPILPFLFITVACGAISGFHCLVSSGTSSKQVACEPDALYVGYGAMLLESALAVIVILACCAGVGMGKFDLDTGQLMTAEDGGPLVGAAAWHERYDSTIAWAEFGLGDKVGAFVEGGANFISATGIPLKYALAVVAVLVACFAATTLDTATRLQRYVIQELAGTFRIAPLTNKYVATLLAVLCGGAMALMPGPKGPGTGGLILWPLFGAVNQLLAGLALMVTAFYLWRRSKPVWFIAAPMVVLLIMPGWAMLWQMFNAENGWLTNENYLLLGIGAFVLALQIWMIVEGVLIWQKAKGVLEEALPPLAPKPDLAGGRSC